MTLRGGSTRPFGDFDTCILLHSLQCCPFRTWPAIRPSKLADLLSRIRGFLLSPRTPVLPPRPWQAWTKDAVPSLGALEAALGIVRAIILSAQLTGMSKVCFQPIARAKFVHVSHGEVPPSPRKRDEVIVSCFSCSPFSDSHFSFLCIRLAHARRRELACHPSMH